MASAAFGRSPPRPFIAAGAETMAPRGFVDLCRRDTAYCTAGDGAGDAMLATGGIGRRRGNPASVAKSPLVAAALVSGSAAATPAGEAGASVDELAQLRRINLWVNGHVRQRTDLEIFGEGEVWQRSGTGTNAVGDCEDIALEKRFQLVAAGFPRERLFLAVVYGQSIGLHAVLVARTASGDVVLDSRTAHLVPWAKAPYSWVAIQSTDDPMVWRSPASRAEVAATAAAPRA